MTMELHQLLSDSSRTVLFAGVGNVLRRDDGVGVYITRGIIPRKGVGGLVVEMGIENYIGKINSLAPEILVITDAVDFGERPGYSRLTAASELREFTTNTHNISLARLSELFAMPVYILGIQPSGIGFGEEMSREVTEAAEKIIMMVNSINPSPGDREQSPPGKSVLKQMT